MSDLLVWNELGNIYFRLGAYEEAIAVYEKAIEQAPDFGWPYSNLGLVHAHRGEYAQAIPLYLRSIQLFRKDKDKAVSWNRLGDAYRHLNDPRGAMGAYQKAVELDVGELEKAVLATSQRGGRAGTAPEMDGSAGSRLDDLKAVEGKPQPKPAADGGVSTWLHQLAVDQDANAVSGEEDRELQTWLQSAPKRSPSTVVPLTAGPGERGAGSPYWVLDTNLPSVPQSVSAPLVKWVPDGPGGLAAAASTACSLESAPLTQVAELEPPAGFAGLVNGASDRENVETAAAPVEGDPSTGEKKRKTGKLEDAAAAYARIAESSPGNDRAWDALGNSLRALGRYDEAVEAFKEAISRRPNNEEYHYHLGLVHAAQKRHAEAVEAFQQVIRLNPDYILAHCALAGSYRRLGREAEAEEHIRIARPAIQAEKEYNRACFEVMCGNPDAALELLKAALVTRQTPVEWMRSDPDLECLHDDPRFQALLCQEA
jgi:tetratricopeptide (TPR) repeat protein